MFEAAVQGPGTRVIRRKLMVPDTPVGAVARERLDDLLRRRIDAHRVVAVTATAGAGKSVAVVHASRTFDRPVAWLSVDATDAVPERLLTYLEESLAAQLPSVRGTVSGALTAGIPAAEAVGLLAEAASDAQVVLVLDDLERLQQSLHAWQIIASMVRYAPPTSSCARSSLQWRARRTRHGSACPNTAGHTARVWPGPRAEAKSSSPDRSRPTRSRSGPICSAILMT